MSTAKAPAAPSDRICEKNIYICRPLRHQRRLAIEYVNNVHGFLKHDYWNITATLESAKNPNSYCLEFDLFDSKEDG